MSTIAQTFSDGVVVTKRNLLKIKRVPELLVFATLSPIMFVLLFAFVFGSAIPLPGIDYKVFLMAGIFTQTVIFGGTITGVSIAEDLQKGLIDRFRSLPMAQSAVLVGRTNADIGNNILVLIVMSLTGLLVGWRITTSVWEALVAYVLLLLFAYAISWVMATIGLLVKSPEVVNNAGVHRHLPGDVHREHVRAHRQLPARAEGHRELEPGVVGDAVRAGAVRQRQPDDAAAGRLARAVPDRLLPHLDRGVAGGLRPGVSAAVQERGRQVRRHICRGPGVGETMCARPDG